jgi:all-trans-retinol 13,14-reductase
MNQAVIIGSGISGLTAALLLRRHGYEVLVIEQQAQAGGALHRFKRQGVSFDVGFHYTGGLGEGEILRALWRYCGIESNIQAIAFPDDAADCIRVDDLPTPVKAYYSYTRFAEELYSLFPQEKKGITQFFQAIKTNSDINPFYNMSQPLTGFLRELAFPEQITLGNLIRSSTTNSYLQAVLSHPVYLHGVEPDSIGLTMHASVAHPVYTGMHSVDGGGQAIADAYLGKLKDAGVEILTHTQVENILTENDRITGIMTSQGEFPASDVIFTGHPSLLPDLVSTKALRKVYRNRLKEMTNTPSMFMVFGAVRDGQYNPQLQWNNYYALHKGLNIHGMNASRPEDCFFVSSCGLRDSRNNSRKDHNQAVILMRPAFWEESAAFDMGRKKRTPEYQSWKEDEGKKLTASVNRKWDGLLDGFQVINTASPLTFRDELMYVRGSAYGVQHSTNQFAVGARTKLPGLWLSGQSTLMPGIMGAALAALITVGGMVGWESLWEEIRECT